MLPDRIFTAFQTSAQGLAVQREKISAASRNIANAGTSAPAGSDKIYRPQAVETKGPARENFGKLLLESVNNLNRPGSNRIGGSGEGRSGLGPQFKVVESDNFRMEFDPNHPDADENGMVRYPDIDMIREMTQMVTATRLYEANLSAIEAEKEIIKRSMDI
ncbi:MAG: flagellar basal body rod protein FlgC [Balneolaceae bacterium]|nr:MAG: flagellar basal body rod protein FlgC [Balneolaceae bacterium]